MENYSFWADLLTTFRTSSDLVKIIWLLSPFVFLFGLIYTVLKLRLHQQLALPIPLMNFQSPQLSNVAVYRTQFGIELLGVDELGQLTPLLSISKDIAKRFEEEADISAKQAECETL